ncbi:hypothetical protein DPMN_034841 [Dreissena polymorpha]|uniref:Exonuclease domain-containing protein n=1 Tax=Dreissena polymorpha TaxID=45954 RepID=A0A9D4RKE7_DREPO|nr:hypothetical protein DPMN_034841 [Dreissena polymorpha]
MPDIIQIAVVHLKTGVNYSTYVKTTVPISSEAQKKIGISVEDHGIMRVNGGSVDSVSIKTSLHDCMMWLEKFPRAIFVAHNGRRFDFPVLVSALLNTHCFETFCYCVSSFVDSAGFQKSYPGQSQKQEDLVNLFSRQPATPTVLLMMLKHWNLCLKHVKLLIIWPTCLLLLQSIIQFDEVMKSLKGKEH